MSLFYSQEHSVWVIVFHSRKWLWSQMWKQREELCTAFTIIVIAVLKYLFVLCYFSSRSFSFQNIMHPSHLEYTYVISMFCIKTMQEESTCNKGSLGSSGNELNFKVATTTCASCTLPTHTSAQHQVCPPVPFWAAHSVCGLGGPFCYSLLLCSICNR